MPQRADSKSRRRVEKISGLFRLFLNKRLAPGVIAKPARAYVLRIVVEGFG
jgi:hypothetical protein